MARRVTLQTTAPPINVPQGPSAPQQLTDQEMDAALNRIQELETKGNRNSGEEWDELYKLYIFLRDHSEWNYSARVADLERRIILGIEGFEGDNGEILDLEEEEEGTDQGTGLNLEEEEEEAGEGQGTVLVATNVQLRPKPKPIKRKRRFTVKQFKCVACGIKCTDGSHLLRHKKNSCPGAPE